MNSLSEILVIIPSYCPPQSFPHLIDQLKSQGFRKIMVINDGSPEDFGKIFAEVSKREVRLVNLSKNFGKGHALKEGIKEAVKNYPGIDYLVFCDDDGQHEPEDVKKLSEYGLNGKDFVIGSRDIYKMPLKSFIGNMTMKIALKYLKGISIPDTQSGLRFMSRKCAGMLMELEHSRFGFELQVLLLLKAKNIIIESFPVKTIYFDKNKSSRFMPLKDSIDVVFSLFSSTKKKDQSK